MKVIVDYDASTGQITDKSGQIVATWFDLRYEPVLETVSATEVNDLVKLKEAGFTTEEMVNLRDRGLI